MDEYEELKKILKENTALVRENNQLLRKMNRRALYSAIFSVVYWVVIIGVPVYLYFNYAKPYLEEFQSIYQNAQAKMEGLPNMPDFNKFFPFLEKSEDVE